jgi:hypothetical protein
MEVSGMLRILNVFLIGLVLASMTVMPPTPPVRAQSVNPVLVGTADLPRSRHTKYGELAASWNTNTVHAIAVNGDNRKNDTFYWRKSDSSLTFPEPVDLGDAGGQTDYTGADVATAWHNQNVVVAVWLDQDTDRIYFRRSDDGGQTWGGTRVVHQGGGFPVTPKVGIRSFPGGGLGEVVITWRDPESFYYTICNAQGEECIGRQYLDGDNRAKAYGQAAIAVGPNGALGIAYVTGATVYARIWDATKSGAAALATRETVAAQNGSIDRYFDTTMAIDRDGDIFVAYRRLDRKLETGGADQGDVFFSRRTGFNSWPRSRISNVQSRGTVAVATDPIGNLHFFWVRARDGANEYFYTKRLPDGGFTNNYIGSSPVFIANGMVTGTLSDWSYGHGTLEAFVPGGQIMRYYLFRTPGDNCVAQTITIGNAIPGTNPPVVRDSSVVGTLAPSTGCTPAEQRVTLNAQDANALAAPWSGTYNVPITNLEQCVQTIHVQLRANNRTQFDPQWRSATFIADPQAADTPVDAAITVMNPKMFGLIPPVFSPVSPAGDMMSEGGASNGDPGYTRIEQMHMRIADIGDCTGISEYKLLFDTGAPFQSDTITGTFASNLPLPPQVQNQSLQVGGTLFRIQVFDRAGNSVTLLRRMVYDPPDPNGRPVMDLSQTSLTTDTNTLTILRSLIINTIVVTDNLYRRGESVPDRGYTNNQTPPNSSDATKQFWGLWIAVEYLGKEANAETLRPPLPAGGLTFDNLRWQPVEVPNAAAGARVRFNLFSGVLDRTAPSPTNGFGPDLTKDGTYRVYVKALDGAGNASTATYSTTLRLDPGYEVPTIRLPIIRR